MKKNMGQYKTGEMLLSIIVPVYNCAPFLEDCLDSLLDQNIHMDYEIICIDDGSIDDSYKILEKYSKEYPWIKVVKQNNGGASVARNKGLDIATGKYVTFVDSDDFLVTGALGRICCEADKRDADNVVFKNFKSVDEDAHYVRTEPTIDLPKKNQTLGLVSSHQTWGCIVKRELIEEHHIRFEAGMKYGEDTLFMFFVYMYVRAEAQLILDDVVYCYRQRKSSIMHQKGNTTQHMYDMLHMVEVYDNFLKEETNLSEGEKQNIKGRIYDAIAAALFDSLRQNKIDATKIRKDLQYKKLYPYPFMSSMIMRKVNIPNIIMAFLKWPIVFEFFNKTGILRKI